MTVKFASKKITIWPIGKLKSHPRQGVFSAHTQAQIDDLAESLAREGLICPIEITPDGTIICGHGRVAAAKQLGWLKIHCWVRHDLVEQGEDAVFRRLVEDNLHRRQLTKLGLGRAFLALKEQQYEEWQAGDPEKPLGDFRDHLGEMLGVDGSTAERWSQLTLLPVAYDGLIEAGLLTQQQAQKIVKMLPSDVWEQLAEKMLKVSQTDLARKTKKQRIKKIVESKIGRPAKSKSSTTVNWSAELCRTLEKTMRNVPEPVLRAVQSMTDAHRGRRLAASEITRASSAKSSASLSIHLNDENRDVLELSLALIASVLSAVDSQGEE